MKKVCLIFLTAVLLLSVSCSKSEGGGEGDKIYYTVTFDAVGGSPAPAQQSVESGNMVSAPSVHPTKTGHVFLFWHLPGATTAYNFQSPVTGHLTLTAKWELEASVEYWQVSWELNGGVWPVGSNPATQIVKGGTLGAPSAPGRSGYTFDGWYKEAALTNRVIFPYDVSSITENFTLFAKWTEIPSALTGTVTITGSAVVGQTLTANTENLGGTGDISYQWKRFDTENSAGTNIAQNGTGSTYTLTDADLGKFIKVSVTRSGNIGSITSGATAAVVKISTVKAEWYSGGSITALFNPLRAVYYIRWPAIPGANSYSLYKSSSATGAGTLVTQTSELSTSANEAMGSSGTYVRYYWVTADINGTETARPANGGIKVTYKVTLSSRVWMPNPTNPAGGYWMTIGSDNIDTTVEQNPVN